jgi:hypothetical protein
MRDLGDQTVSMTAMEKNADFRALTFGVGQRFQKGRIAFITDLSTTILSETPGSGFQRAAQFTQVAASSQLKTSITFKSLTTYTGRMAGE